MLLWLGLVVSGGMEVLCDWSYTDMRECSNGASVLYMASSGGHLSCVEALIRSKADVLQFDK